MKNYAQDRISKFVYQSMLSSETKDMHIRDKKNKGVKLFDRNDECCLIQKFYKMLPILLDMSGRRNIESFFKNGYKIL